MRDLINSRFGGVMGRKLVGDAPDPIVPKRSALRYGVKVANSAAAARTRRADASIAAKNDAESLNNLLTQRIQTVLGLLHAAGPCLGVELFGSRYIAERPERAPGIQNDRVIGLGQREGGDDFFRAVTTSSGHP